MPKASFASKDAYTPNMGFQEGPFEVADASIVIFQYPPSRDTGEQFAPFTALKLTVHKLDEQGNRTEDEPMEKILRIEKDPSKLRPGKASSRDDADPEDLGDELDTEGNCIFCDNDSKINANSGFMVFMRSLEEKGIKPEYLYSGYAPDLVGLKAIAISKKGDKRNINGKDLEPNYFVVDRILQHPGEKATKKPAGKAVTKAAPAGKTAAPAKAATPAASATIDTTAVSGDADDVATGILAEIAADLDGETRDSKKLYAMAYSRLVKDKNRDKKLDKAVQDLFRSDEWLIEKAADMGFTYEDGVFTFGEVATAA